MKYSKLLAAGFAVALAGGVMVGCGSQAPASSSASAEASSAAVEQTTDELIAELDAISANKNYSSVTMTGNLDMTVDMSAALGSAASAESAESASAESADAASGESSTMNVATTYTAEADIPSSKMHMKMEMFGQEVELYITGQDAVMVTGGEAYSGTLEELGMEQYASIDALMQNQGANFEMFKNSVKDITKVTEGEESVYTIVCDTAKFIEDNPQTSSLSALGDNIEFGDTTVIMRVDSQDRITLMDIALDTNIMTMKMTATCSDYDATTVPEAPEATKSIADMGAEAEAAIDAASDAVSSEASAA